MSEVMTRPRATTTTRGPVGQALLIFPCNGNGAEALDCLGSKFHLASFIDDQLAARGDDGHGHRVAGREALHERADAQVLAVPGGPSSYLMRRTWIQQLGVDPARWATVIHPSAQVSWGARIGRNVLIMAGAVVSPHAVIGDHVCILPNSVIHHDSVVGDFTLVGSNVVVAGGVTVGENCYLGSGTTVKNGVRIGDGALTGLGSTVIRDVPQGARVAGCPARVLA